MRNNFLRITSERCIFIEDIPEENQLERIRELIKADCIESVTLPGDICLLVDESGKLKDKDFNFFASMLYPGFPFDYIVGDVILCKLVGPDIAPLDDDDLAFFFKLFNLALSLDLLLGKDEVAEDE